MEKAISGKLSGQIRYNQPEKIRIDVFLGKEEIASLSRSRIKEFITHGHITVNNLKIKPSYILKPGDLVSFSIPNHQGTPLPAEDIPLNIYYEDEHIMVVDKEAGMIVHPTGKVKSGTLVNALLFHCRRQLPDIGGKERPGIVHRLDKETSGLLMVAKTEPAHHFLSQQLKEREIVKKYLALVKGVVLNQEGCIEAPIGRHPKHGNKMAVTGIKGREAITYFQVVRQFGSFTLLLITLYTGRTHQIRVHLQFIGHPVVGDKVYGLSKEKNSLIIIKRQALHAHFLQFRHPVTHQLLDFTSLLPADFQEQLRMLAPI
ncbi:MAG: RluA family pseudouridine synthase [Candidatus Atribacteria bacterium]|nr:RluA family pseudouridine synthase [Candidatus Atribacteria bacterium]